MDICWACCTINTETSTHVPTKFRFFVALLYLNQCPLDSIISKCLSLFVQCNQSLQNVNSSQYRFLHCGGLWTDEQKAQVDNSLAMFLEAGIKKPNLDGNVDHTSLVQILDLPCESPKEQFMLLSSVSNFHKFGYPAMCELSSKSIISPNHITYAEHVLYDPFSKEDMEGNNIRKYIPVSPRNRIMYFLVMFKEAEMYHLLRYLLLKDQGTDEHDMEYETHEIPIPKKREETLRKACVSHMKSYIV